MVQAYRRGLLAPTLPFGKRSKLREDLLLESIEAEMRANQADRASLLTTIMAAAMKIPADSRKKFISDLFRDMTYTEYLRVANFDAANQFEFENSGLAETAIYEMMAEAGWVTGADPDHSDG